MVNRKGAGYSLEAIVAVATVVIFVLGGLTIPENQDWSDFRVQASANDLTYALKESGYLNHALSEGEVGSIQTAVSTITERDLEVSGLVSNLPIAQNKVAFYVLPKDRYTQSLENISSGDVCEGDLGEISSRSEEEVLKTDGTGLAGIHDTETLYMGDLDPNSAGGNNKMDYDTVWVDNGSECQFSSSEGPHRIDDIIRWENASYDTEWINGNTKEMRIFNATQPARFGGVLNRPVNSVDTFVTIDAVNFTELESSTYNVLVLRSNESVELVDGVNQTIVTDFLEQGSILTLADLSSSNFDSGDFLKKLGFRYRNVSYKGGYSGGEIRGVFPSKTDAQDTESYFKGLNGEATSLSVKPSGTLSDTESTIESSGGILHSTSESYNFSEWNRANYTMQNVTAASISGEPTSSCYSEKDSALTNGSLTFPNGETYSFINAELGTSASYCASNNVRAIEIDLDQDGDYLGRAEGPYLNDQILQVANRSYAVNILPADGNPGCGEGDCILFRFLGDNSVELVSRRKSFPNIEGEKMAVSGYEEDYEANDLRLLSSVIHWLRGDRLSFVGLASPEGISTTAYSGIKDETYLPYRLSLRWSK